MKSIVNSARKHTNGKRHEMPILGQWNINICGKRKTKTQCCIDIGKKTTKTQTQKKNSFKMKVTGKYKSALDRQVLESVKIKNFDSSLLINQRNEWRHLKALSLIV